MLKHPPEMVPSERICKLKAEPIKSMPCCIAPMTSPDNNSCQILKRGKEEGHQLILDTGQNLVTPKSPFAFFHLLVVW